MSIKTRRIIAVIIMVAAAVASIWVIDRRVQERKNHVKTVDPAQFEAGSEDAS